MIHTHTSVRQSSNALRRLIGKHYLQIGAQAQPEELGNLSAITFRPGRDTASFHGGLLRRVGTTVMITMSYEPHPTKPGRLAMPIRGLRGTARPDGSVRYDDSEGRLFEHDGRLFPRSHYGRAINVVRNPGLVETLLSLDKACKRQLELRGRLPHAPRMPRVMLGFAPTDPPAWEDSSALRRIAAQRLNLPQHQLGTNGDALLDRLLHDTWERQVVQPAAAGNSTGLLLIDADLCTQARRALAIYEDFSDLVGVHTWNPARGIRLLTSDNPAGYVLRRYGIDTSSDFNQYFSDEQIDRLEQAMREAIGAPHMRYTLEEILDGLTTPGSPLVAYGDSVPKLRARLSASVSECCTDDDLVRIVRCWLAGLAKSRCWISPVPLRARKRRRWWRARRHVRKRGR